MDWWLAVLVIYLKTISGWLVAIGFIFLGMVGLSWIIFSVKWDNFYWKQKGNLERNKVKIIPTRIELMKSAIRRTKIFVPVAILLFFLSTAVPTPQTLFKIVALKYGTDAAFSSEAKNIGNKLYESMDKSLSLLNSKLDEWNTKKSVK